VRRTGQVPFMKLQVGILSVAALVLILWATFQSGAFEFGKQEDITVHFANVGGLEEDSQVRLNGVPVGTVRRIELEPKSSIVKVVLGVKEGTRSRLHQGATARITTVGFLSELYVALDTGNEALPMIHSDDEINAALMTDPQVLISEVKQMADTVEVILSNLNAATKGFASGHGTLGRLARDERLYDNLVAMSRNANELASRMNETQSRVANRLMTLAASFDSLSWRMQHGEGTVAQLMTSGELHRSLTESTQRADSIMALLQSGKGSLGKMMADSTLYDDTRALMSSMKRLMAEIEKDPKKYFKFSLF
jgi:phospholipid/cholesterol/gamma-HCH transport system substrate-binding protein